jgi:hypothetical protein
MPSELRPRTHTIVVEALHALATVRLVVKRLTNLTALAVVPAIATKTGFDLGPNECRCADKNLEHRTLTAFCQTPGAPA